MAQKAIREYYGKKLIYTHLKKFIKDYAYDYQGISIDGSNIDKVKLPTFVQGYVAKPDDLFGKRGKNKLIHANKNAKKALDWVESKIDKEVVVKKNEQDKGINGVLEHFLIEQFIPHEDEYYLAIKTGPVADVIYFSTQGGVDIEENWEGVLEIKIPFNMEPTPLLGQAKVKLEAALANDPNKDQIFNFISGVYQVFRLLDFTYLEINPFAVVDGQVHMLDLVARLDDTAFYKNYPLLVEPLSEQEQNNFEFFPAPFGTKLSKAEKQISDLDKKSGASLKVTILNPNGRIWLLTSGGGASVILADTVGDLGFADELANYCDYSGNPTTDETFEVAKILMGEMLKSKAKNKVLVIAGGIANFTDIKNTFTGIVSAIQLLAKDLLKQKIKIYVRRGGPNYEQGLAYIKAETEKLGIPIEVHGPELYMTEVINLALSKTK